ncbi:MAG: hypothetical protein P4L51_06360 [Puia sp.]|nr:hypothetical protein [Puia sp.]
MLHAKELRYGNKVFNSKGEIITVQQILCSTIIYDTQMNISAELAPVKGFYESSYSSQMVEVVKEAEYQEIDPILLTPGILEKCGFRNFIREEWIVTYGNNSHADFEFTSDGLRLRHPTPSRVSILYLHQLQNFFFAVTGLELEVNL